MSVSTAEAREQLADILNRTAYSKERITITRRGREVAAIIPIEDLRLLELLVEEFEDKMDIDEARAALREAEKGGTVSLSEVRKRLDL